MYIATTDYSTESINALVSVFLAYSQLDSG